MRLAVTGRHGQVVLALLERAAAVGHVVVPVGRPELDLADDNAARVLAALEAAQPDVIVSAAAYTAVDQAESERDLAFAINARGAGLVAQAASKLGVPLLHLSTDYVFAGDAAASYTESDICAPQGVYGASKWAGEQAVLENHADSVVLRTAWVVSPFGTNFVRTMLRLAVTREEINVVADQHGNPTDALAIADAILTVARNLLGSADLALRGVFHMACHGETTWAGLAAAVFEMSEALGGPSAQVRPIGTAEYPTAARRPANSRLNCGRLLELHGVALPSWRDAIAVTVARLAAASQEQEYMK
jgi:dTDP-4-dehydrorhamnose reductase